MFVYRGVLDNPVTLTAFRYTFAQMGPSGFNSYVALIWIVVGQPWVKTYQCYKVTATATWQIFFLNPVKHGILWKIFKKRVPASQFTLTRPAKKYRSFLYSGNISNLWICSLPTNYTRILHVHILQVAITVIFIKPWYKRAIHGVET